jgi:hypothetical protein
VDFEQWTREARLRTLAEAYGPEVAERLLGRSALFNPEPALHGRHGPLVSDEQQARDLGLSVEAWRALAR